MSRRILKRKGVMCMLDGKKIIILGDRDGVPGGAIEACLAGKNVEIVFSTTACFV
jgi:glycine/sarcosine/betaine reductase complex component A